MNKRNFVLSFKFYSLLLISLILVLMISIFIPKDSKNFVKLIVSVSDTTSFEQSPIYIGAFKVGDKKNYGSLGAIALWNDQLFVSYKNSGKVDVFDDRFRIVNSYNFSNDRKLAITGITVDDNFIYIADSLNQEICIYDHDGYVKNVFGWYPESKQRIGCYGLYVKENILYLTDSNWSNVLAISISPKSGFTEMGELLFQISGKINDQELFSPSAIIVTSDGRILVGDNKGGIKVFTCDGRYVYEFGNKNKSRIFSPNDFAFDQVQSPELLSKLKATFVTSKISEQGRIHVLDSKIARIKVYDELGQYILTYGKELEQPFGIAINQKRRIIIISDLTINSLVVYKY